MTDNSRLLADPRDLVPMDVHAALHAHFGSVPGVHVVDVGLRKADVDHWSMLVTVQGWSPSLHEITIHYMRDVPVDDGASVITADDAVDAFNNAVAEQRRRANDALSMGRPKPLNTDDHSNNVADKRKPICRHLHVDRALPVLAHIDGDDLGRLVASNIHDLHDLPSESDGGPVLADSVTYVIEDMATRLVGVTVPIDTVDSKPATFDGRWLRIGGGVELPETVVKSLIGRKVCDILPLHPVIDDRVILEAQANDEDGNLALRIETHTIPMTEIDRELERWRGKTNEE